MIIETLGENALFAPAGLNRQRAAAVAGLGAEYFSRGETVTAGEHVPVYLRMSQAEREYVEIREAEADQAPLLAQFEQAGLPDAWSEKDLQKLLENKCRHAYVALRRGTPVAYCLIQAVEDEGEVLRIVTLPEWRRKGIASRLLAETEKRNETVKNWNLEVREHNLPARTLYAKAGYREIHVRPAYYADTKEAAVCMQKGETDV